MSFDIFVGCFGEGATATFQMATFDAIFGPHISKKDKYCCELNYDGRYAGDVYMNWGSAEERGFMVNRPGGQAEFWRDLIRFLKQTNTALYWPGTSVIVIGQAGVAPHLPADMVKTLGSPVIVNDPEEIWQWLERS